MPPQEVLSVDRSDMSLFPPQHRCFFSHHLLRFWVSILVGTFANGSSSALCLDFAKTIYENWFQQAAHVETHFESRERCTSDETIFRPTRRPAAPEIVQTKSDLFRRINSQTYQSRQTAGPAKKWPQLCRLHLWDLATSVDDLKLFLLPHKNSLETFYLGRVYLYDSATKKRMAGSLAWRNWLSTHISNSEGETEPLYYTLSDCVLMKN